VRFQETAVTSSRDNPQAQDLASDQVLEACLAEVLNGRRPPDLSEKILSALEVAPEKRPIRSALPPAGVPPVPLPHDERATWAVLAACVALVGVGLLVMRPWESRMPVASAPDSRSAGEGDFARNGDEFAQGPRDVGAGTSSVGKTGAVGSGRPQASVNLNERGGDGARQVAVGSPAAGQTAGNHQPLAPAPPRSDADVIVFISTQIRQGWAEANVRPSEMATDREWCRRVYLDLVGRIPTVPEVEHFLADPQPTRRTILLDRLLIEQDDEFARHMATLWTHLLVGRSAGWGTGARSDRAGLAEYLRQAFHENRPFDQWFTELITAQGSNQPGEGDFNPAVNFLAEQIDSSAGPMGAAHAATRVSRLFLAEDVDCARCHEPQPPGLEDPLVASLGMAFRDVSVVRMDEAATPSAFRVEGGLDARRALVEQFLADPSFAETMVNRTWTQLLGAGFPVESVDEVAVRPSSHAGLLKGLAADFAASGYDLRRLLRWIVESEPYSLTSRYNESNRADDPAAGLPPLFSRFYLRQMNPEQLYDSIVTAAAGADAMPGSSTPDRDRWLRQFVIPSATDDRHEATLFNGSIPQMLALLNGELIDEAIRTDDGSLLSRVANDASLDRPEQKVAYLYTAALGREPSRRELELAASLWSAQPNEPPDDSVQPLQDLWWTLLNTNEFILNH
jgi:hypothetical protein